MTKDILLAKSVVYRTEKEAIIKGVDLAVETGDFLTLTGPSGGGKSTFLKLLASLLSPSDGKIYYKGTDLSELDPVAYRREVSYAFQQPVLFGETVYDNLVFPFEVREVPVNQKRIREKLAQVYLDEAFLEKKISELSGGERQRIALLRNILFIPEVLLLDEVTVGLDEESKKIVNQLIQQVHHQGATIIRVTHDSEELAQSAKIIQITGGKLDE
ncbi:ABC transporter ATP-binding protein [Enterococcus sp. LJL51]|uniref:ABC transporter ATP-binding protein n=1 Tax=Enterococcus sp. LJL51 TaxID=3416656 RepID=UPI003CEBFE11